MITLKLLNASALKIIISRLLNIKRGYSDEDISIYRLIKITYAPIKEKDVIVDTSQSLNDIVAEVANRIKKWTLSNNILLFN